MTQISVVVPVYRSAKTLRDLYRRLVTSLASNTSDFEIILVEDCGGDGSWEVIEELASLDSRVKGIQLSRNFGQHAATICGISKSTGDWVITLDDDPEQPPDHITDLLAKAPQGYALVYGICGRLARH